MKTLGEIIDAVRDGKKPSYDDLKYAICAMDALMVFDKMALEKLADAEEFGKKPFMVYSSIWQRDDRFERVRKAMKKPPKEYIGWNNDPENPDFLARRKAATKLMESLIKNVARK